jgi:predicted Zn-dependent peptidase
MPRDGLVGYMANRYRAPRMIVAAAGKIEPDEITRLASEAFGGLKTGGDTAMEPARYVGGEWREERDLEQVHLVLGFQGVSYTDPDFYAASVFSTLFGGGMSSRLFQEVRESRGLAYNVHAFMSCYDDGGMFGIYAGTGEAESVGLTPLLIEETLKVRDTVRDEEVARARAQLKASILMSLESTYSRAEQMARQLMIYGRLVPVQEVIDAVEAVDTAAVMRAATRLTSSKPTLAVLGPVKSVMALDQIEKALA